MGVKFEERPRKEKKFYREGILRASRLSGKYPTGGKNVRVFSERTTPLLRG